MVDFGIVTRPARPGDADPLWPLVRDFATSFEPRREAFDETLPALLARDDTRLVVAEDGGRIVGYLLASVHPTFLANGPVAWVEEVMVEEPARRRGVGRALMADADRWAGDLGAAYVSLASRRAGEFYRELGYEESATFFRRLL